MIKGLLGWIIPIAVGVLIALALKTYLVSFAKVDGSSMYPNLHNNERLVLLKNKPIKRLSVVVFDAHNVAPGAKAKTYYVKRVIALPGDKLVYTKTGKLYVNGKYVKQSFISKQQQKSGTLSNVSQNGFTLNSISKKWPRYKNQKIVKVPKGDYFVMGDNRAISYDSRYWGFVPKSKMAGVVYVPWGNHKAEVNKAS